jgi:hypothetical protein
MVGSSPTCSGTKSNGELCRATPMRDSGLCFWHDPDYAAEAKEAQRIGGLRRRTEATISAAFDFEGLRTVDQIWRFIELAAIDTLRLENGAVRNRTMGSLSQIAMKLLGIGEHEERLRAIEDVLGPKLKRDGRRR